MPYRGYTLKEITLVPAPERLPVECWQPIQSGSERAFDFMAKYGVSGVIGQAMANEPGLPWGKGRFSPLLPKLLGTLATLYPPKPTRQPRSVAPPSRTRP